MIDALAALGWAIITATTYAAGVVACVVTAGLTGHPEDAPAALAWPLLPIVVLAEHARTTHHRLTGRTTR